MALSVRNAVLHRPGDSRADAGPEQTPIGWDHPVGVVGSAEQQAGERSVSQVERSAFYTAGRRSLEKACCSAGASTGAATGGSSTMWRI